MKLSRGGGARMALRRALIKALVVNGAIVTTKAKVKFVQRDVEKLVSDSIKADLAKRRKIFAFLGNDRDASNMLFELANKFGSRSSGFTRMILLPKRRGDNAEMARLEWTEKTVLKDIVKSDKSAKKEDKTKGKSDKSSEKAAEKSNTSKTGKNKKVKD